MYWNDLPTYTLFPPQKASTTPIILRTYLYTAVGTIAILFLLWLRFYPSQQVYLGYVLRQVPTISRIYQLISFFLSNEQKLVQKKIMLYTRIVPAIIFNLSIPTYQLFTLFLVLFLYFYFSLSHYFSYKRLRFILFFAFAVCRTYLIYFSHGVFCAIVD